MVYFTVELFDKLNDSQLLKIDYRVSYNIGSKVRGFKLCRGEGFLRAIKIRSTPSFGEPG
jgi:hypothetical protein